MGLTINATYDAQVTALQSTNPSLYNSYVNAINTAINFYENLVKNPIAINITFGYGEINNGSYVVSGGAVNSTNYLSISYSNMRSDLLTAYNNSSSSPDLALVAQTAGGTLPTTDPTGGAGRWYISQAEAAAIVPGDASIVATAYVGIAQSTLTDPSNGTNWSFNQSSIASNQYDAVAALEHEISEVLGRADAGGQSKFDSSADYEPLDLFRYTAADGLGADAPGSAVGGRAEPFAAGYNASTPTYFSYNGTTVTLPYDTQAQVSSGADVADWTNSVLGDAYGYLINGYVGAVSQTDLSALAVLGYDLNCFGPGTRLAAVSGDVAVEDLNVGDLLLTHDGGVGRVRWVGRQTVSTRCADPLSSLPVRISQGALGGDLPRRDLWVSTGHAIFIGGVLINAGALVNGVTIYRDVRMPETFTYYHVDVGEHCLVLAEGVPAETFLESLEEGAFDNWGERAANAGASVLPAEMAYPRVKAARQVPAAVRQVIRAQIDQVRPAIDHAA